MARAAASRTARTPTARTAARARRGATTATARAAARPTATVEARATRRTEGPERTIHRSFIARGGVLLRSVFVPAASPCIVHLQVAALSLDIQSALPSTTVGDPNILDGASFAVLTGLAYTRSIDIQCYPITAGMSA